VSGIAEQGMPAACTVLGRQPVVSATYSSAKADSFSSGACKQKIVKSSFPQNIFAESLEEELNNVRIFVFSQELDYLKLFNKIFNP